MRPHSATAGTVRHGYKRKFPVLRPTPLRARAAGHTFTTDGPVVSLCDLHRTVSCNGMLQEKPCRTVSEIWKSKPCRIVSCLSISKPCHVRPCHLLTFPCRVKSRLPSFSYIRAEPFHANLYSKTVFTWFGHIPVRGVNN